VSNLWFSLEIQRESFDKPELDGVSGGRG
jgi:hypothetical protein